MKIKVFKKYNPIECVKLELQKNAQKYPSKDSPELSHLNKPRLSFILPLIWQV